MKQFSSHLIAGIAGGVIVFLCILFVPFSDNSNALKSIETQKDNFLEVKNQPYLLYTGERDRTVVLKINSFSGIVDETINSVVHIKAIEKELSREAQSRDRKSIFDFWSIEDFMFHGPKKGFGSGVIVSQSGLIVTNYHVVKDADKIIVTLKNGNRYMAIWIGADPKADLALLKIDARNLPTIQYADSDLAEVGDWVIAIGNPFNKLPSTVTAGIISAKGRHLNLRNSSTQLESFIQTDAVINPGNSGGALIDSRGRLLGINTAIYTPTGVFAGYSFAIPSNLVRKIVDAMLDEGLIRRATLGISITENDHLLMKNYDLGTSDGWVIHKINQGSSAQYAGLHPYDVILEIDGEKLDSQEQLIDIMNKKRVGDTLDMLVMRKGKKKHFTISLRK